jgi:SAM-dependent methyltransferase
MQEPPATPSTRYSECRICGHRGEAPVVEAREMMFGSGEHFDYFRCPACGCLQIAAIPADLGAHYVGDYYSLELDPGAKFGHGLRRWRKAFRLARLVDERAWVQRLFTRLAPDPALAAVAALGLSKSARILDVGCGGGLDLYRLHLAGFRNLLGVDPFIPADIVHEGGVRIVKTELAALDGTWDIVTFHHSLEHLADQAETLRAAAARLAPGGRVVVRVPLVSSWAWEHYGTDWVGLDAPRHLYLHTPESLAVAASAAGLEIAATVYDSGALQFWGSEQYRRGIALTSARSHARDPKSSIFTRREMAQFERRAKRLNAERRGDQAAFTLRRVDEAGA